MNQIFHFTIRELLILTMAAGLAVSWRMDRRALADCRAHAKELRGVLSISKMNTEVYAKTLQGTPMYLSCGTTYPIAWDLLDKPIP